MTTAPPSLSRQAAAVEVALNHVRQSAPKALRMSQSALDMLRGDLAAALETLRTMEKREADAIAFAREVVR